MLLLVTCPKIPDINQLLGYQTRSLEKRGLSRYPNYRWARGLVRQPPTKTCNTRKRHSRHQYDDPSWNRIRGYPIRGQSQFPKTIFSTSISTTNNQVESTTNGLGQWVHGFPTDELEPLDWRAKPKQKSKQIQKPSEASHSRQASKQLINAAKGVFLKHTHGTLGFIGLEVQFELTQLRRPPWRVIQISAELEIKLQLPNYIGFSSADSNAASSWRSTRRYIQLRTATISPKWWKSGLQELALA